MAAENEECCVRTDLRDGVEENDLLYVPRARRTEPGKVSPLDCARRRTHATAREGARADVRADAYAERMDVDAPVR